MHQLLQGGEIFTLDDEKSLIISSKGDGSLVIYTGCKTTESWARSAGLNFTNATQMRA